MNFAPPPATRGSPVGVAVLPLPTPLPLPPPLPVPSLVVTVPSAVQSAAPPLPALPPATPSPQHVDPPMRDTSKRPCTLPAVKRLVAGFEHHLINNAPLPSKRASCGRLPGALTKANLGVADAGIAIPVVDTIECAFNMSESMEPRTLTDAISRPDTASWITTVLAEIEAHLKNSTWELAQLLPGRRAIGSHWVFKVKQKPDRSIDKYKGRIVAQGFSQVQGVHYNEVFASAACMAVMCTVIAMAATEDLELERVSG